MAHKIAHGYWQSTLEGESRFLFVRSESSTAFAEFVDRLRLAFAPEALWLHRSDLKANTLEVYFPFLTLIKAFLEENHLAVEPFCRSADIYPSQREVFRSYFSGGLCEWSEEPIIDEITYERRQMLRSIGALLVEASRTRPILVAIDNLQYGDISLWRLMQGLHQMLPKGRFLIVAGFSNRATVHHGEEQTHRWNEFMGYLDEHGVVVDLAEGPTPDALDAGVDRRESSPLPALAAQTRNALRLFAFEEATAWGIAAHDRLREQHELDLDAYTQVLTDLGDAYLYLFAADEALIYYEQMLQLAQEQGNETLQIEAYRRMALACMNKHDAATAYRYGQLAVECAFRFDDEALLFKALLAVFVVEDKFTHTIEPHYYRNLNALTERHGGQNTQIYLLNMSYLYREYYGNDFQHLLKLNDKASDIAETMQNEFALAVGYHKRSIIYSQLDDNEASFRCLAESEAIRWRLDEKLEIVRACNGIGYLSLIRDDYESAFAYFNKAVRLFGSIRDYNEIAMTLYNLASLYYRTGQYHIAIHIMEKVIQVMSILGITHIPFRDISSIYALKGICHFKVNDWIKGVECLSRIGTLERSRDPETVCYISILKAYEASLEPDIDQVRRLFPPIVQELTGSLKAHNRLLPWALWEYASILAKLGDEEAAEAQLVGAIHLADALFMPRLSEWLRADLGKRAVSNRVDLPEPSFDLEALVALARQEVTLKKLHHVVRNMKFLHGLQTQLGRSNDMQTLAGHFTRLLMSFCPAQLVALHIQAPTGWRLLSSIPDRGTEVKGLTSIISALQQGGAAVYRDRNQSEPEGAMLPQPFSSAINLHVQRAESFSVNLLIATLDEGLSLAKGEMQVMSIALNQLVTVLEKIRHEEKLLYLSTVDELTGLANRQALLSRLQNEIARASRYRSQESPRLSVAFIDLDNFKYYNDRFGHDVGDLLIRAFGQLVCGSVRECDFVARYGGDEFIVILPETDESLASAVMQRVIEALDENGRFQALLRSILGHEPDIPEEKRLTCSAGVAGLAASNFDMDAKDLLKQADHALYDAKNAGKNQVRVWRAAQR